LLALIAIFFLDRMDNRWRGAQDVNDRLRMGNLGSVPNGPPMLDAPAAYVRERLPAVSEAQTNIMLASSGVRTLLLSSPTPSEARTALSVDLADLFGRSGQRVLIVDADFAASFLTRMLAAPSAPHTWTVMPDDAR